MKIERYENRTENELTLRMEGNLGFDGAEALKTEIMEAINGIWQKIILDLSETEDMFGCELMSRSEPFAKLFSWFGKYSMQILVTHMFVAMLVTRFTGWPCGFVLMSQREEIESIEQVFQTIALYFVTTGLLVCWLLVWGKMKEGFKEKHDTEKRAQ